MSSDQGGAGRRSFEVAGVGLVSIVVGLTVSVGLAACGTTDEASRMTLPPLETTTTTTTTTTLPSLDRFVTVQRGDILAVIAAEQGVTVESIVELNGLESADDIQAGQVLEMPENRVLVPVQTDPEP